MAPHLQAVADVHELDNGGGTGHRYLPAAAVICFSVRPANPRKWDLPVLDSIFRTLSAMTATLFFQRL